MTRHETPSVEILFTPLSKGQISPKVWSAAALLAVAFLGAGSLLLRSEGVAIAAERTGSPAQPIQDKTGLAGRYDFTLPWYDKNDAGGEISNSMDRMPISDIGLILKPGKGPGFIINIASIERPSTD